jgi:hypothetical protein
MFDMRLARQKLGKKNTPPPWRPPSPYGRHGAPPPAPPHTTISQHDAQQVYVVKTREGRKTVVFHESSPNFPAGKRIVQF